MWPKCIIVSVGLVCPGGVLSQRIENELLKCKRVFEICNMHLVVFHDCDHYYDYLPFEELDSVHSELCSILGNKCVQLHSMKTAFQSTKGGLFLDYNRGRVLKGVKSMHHLHFVDRSTVFSLRMLEHALTEYAFAAMK